MADDFGGFDNEDVESNDGFGSESESGGDDFGFGFIEVDEEEEGFGIEFVSEEEFQKEQEEWQEEDRKAAEMLKWDEDQLARETNPTTTIPIPTTTPPPTTTATPTTTQFESTMPTIDVQQQPTVDVETNNIDETKKEVEILGQKKGWCDYKLIGKGAATIMRKNKWKPIWVELSREGVMVLKKMVNDPEPLATIEVPYAKLMEDPGGSKIRFAMGLKAQTYYFEAKTENEVELWMSNIEKAKKRNRRRSAYGRQTNQSTLMVF